MRSLREGRGFLEQGDLVPVERGHFETSGSGTDAERGAGQEFGPAVGACQGRRGFIRGPGRGQVPGGGVGVRQLEEQLGACAVIDGAQVECGQRPGEIPRRVLIGELVHAFATGGRRVLDRFGGNAGRSRVRVVVGEIGGRYGEASIAHALQCLSHVAMKTDTVGEPGAAITRLGHQRMRELPRADRGVAYQSSPSRVVDELEDPCGVHAEHLAQHVDAEPPPDHARRQ